jgi:hypothetical protein
MLPRKGPSPPRLFRRPSFAGRGLLERTRSTGFALLGITAAMGLGLVALVSQQSWPYLPASPIPEYGAEQGRVDSAIAVAPPPAGFGTPASHSPARKDLPERGAARRGTNDARLSRSDPVSVDPDISGPTGPQSTGEGTTPPAAPGPDPSSSVPPPPPIPQTPAPAPPSVPAPQAAVNPPADPPAVASGNPGKGNAYGRQKAAAASTAKPSHASSHASSTPVTPPAASAPATPEAKPSAPAAPGSDGPGNAYGHDK